MLVHCVTTVLNIWFFKREETNRASKAKNFKRPIPNFVPHPNEHIQAEQYKSFVQRSDTKVLQQKSHRKIAQSKPFNKKGQQLKKVFPQLRVELKSLKLSHLSLTCAKQRKKLRLRLCLELFVIQSAYKNV